MSEKSSSETVSDTSGPGSEDELYLKLCRDYDRALEKRLKAVAARPAPTHISELGGLYFYAPVHPSKE